MKAAFSAADARIAPVFDAARQVIVVDADSGRAAGEADATLPDGLPIQKVMGLADLGVDTLVCGAISWPLHAMVTASGIRVIPFVAGAVSEVVQSWISGTIEGRTFAMPGCGRRRGWARGRGPLGPRGGKGPGPRAGRAAGTCVCLVCGHCEPHERGVACAGRPCPACGAHMVREF